MKFKIGDIIRWKYTKIHGYQVVDLKQQAYKLKPIFGKDDAVILNIEYVNINFVLMKPNYSKIWRQINEQR